MIPYLHVRNLFPVFPGEGGEGSGLELSVVTSCQTNNGDQGSITVRCVPPEESMSIRVELHRGWAADNLLEVATLDSAFGFAVTFDGYADDDYFVIAKSHPYTATDTVALSCYKSTEQPPDYLAPNEVMLEKIYLNPTYSQEGGKTYILHNMRVWKFNKTTEKAYLTEGVFRQAPSTPAPVNWITSNPFYGYCVPNTTTRRDFYYYHEGKVEKKEDTKSGACGFSIIFGCTDPTATNYNPNATVEDYSCYYRPQVFGCTDPNATNYDPAATDDDGSCVYAPEVRNPVLSVSIMNSLRFVATENVDNCGTFQTLDNTLFCKERHRGVRNPSYHQKVARCDQHIYQFRTNYANLALNIRKESDNSIVGTIVPALAVQNVGTSGVFSVYLKNNTNSQTRVYFNTSDIPMPVSVGDSIIITNHVDSNGTYAIIEIKQDVQTQTPYLVINKAYTATDTTTSASVQFQMANADYNVMEATVTWADYPSGRYYVTLEATDPDFVNASYTSEPLILREEHPDTFLLEYRNYDNAFDMVYTTGIINRVRIEGEIRLRIPGGEHVMHEEPQSRITRLLGIAHRNVRMNTWKLPPWLHEKLSVALIHDEVSINGVQFACPEGYDEPEYVAQHALSNGGATIRQVEWFREHNDHDLGSINQQPLLIVNGGFLRL